MALENRGLVQEEHFLRDLNSGIGLDIHAEVVAGVMDKIARVISINDGTLTYSGGLRGGLQAVSCKHFMNALLANLNAFEGLSSLHLEQYDGPLFMEHWPQSLRMVSLARQHDLKTLNRLNNLRGLGLLWKNVDLAEIGAISSQLRELSFNSCMDEEQLRQFINLEWLAYGRHKGNLTPLGSLKHLSHLFIEDLQNPTLDGLEGCEQLAYLRIQSNQLLDISALKECVNLEEVTFIPTGEAIRSIEALRGSGLQTLNISYSGVTDFAPIQTMTRLRTLNLSGCLIDDLSVLDGLEQLRTIYLGDITAADSPYFFRPLLSLPQLQNIYISPNSHQFIPDELKERTALWFPPIGLSKGIAKADQDLNSDFGDPLTSDEFDALLSSFQL